MDRAYSLLTIKSIDAPTRRIQGIASTPDVDRDGDVLDPAGVTFRNPVPLLLHHRQTEPIGTAFLTVTPDGIAFDATLPIVDEAGPLRTRVDDVWQSVKAGVLSGASIGFRILADGVKQLAPGRRHLTRTEICELSLVTIPSNANATIRLVKSLSSPLENRSMTAADHVANLETKRATIAGQMADVLTVAADADRTLTADEAATHDGLSLSLKAVDADLARWKAQEQLQIGQAQAVPNAPRPMAGFPVSVKSNLPAGTAFVRAACAKYVCKGDSRQAIEYAQARWKDTPEVALYLKAAATAGTTTDPLWAGPLVQHPVANEFIELLRPATFLEKIKGLNKVPFNTSMPAQTAGGSYGWVGEGAVKPVTSLGFGTVSLGMSKVAGIVVITKELAMLSNPDAERVVRNDMIKGIAQFINGQFIDPAVAAVAGINPASVTNTAPNAPATTDPLADVLGLVHYFAANGVSVDGLTFLLSPANALAMSFKTNVDGSDTFAGFGVNGGTFKGMQFIASEVVGTNVIGLQPSAILYAQDGGVEIDVSQEASVAMDAAAPTALVSLWQTNRIGIRAETFANWNKINPNAVRYLTGAVYPVPGATGGAVLGATSKK